MSNIYTIHLASQCGSYLSSRHSATALRQEILTAIDTGKVEQCVIDLSEVWTISDSFADELFSILILKRGEEWFKQHIKLENIDPDIRISILQAIQTRLSNAV